eukprot:scaffold255259_cov19-Tisochrysis_lutea.AAC.1
MVSMIWRFAFLGDQHVSAGESADDKDVVENETDNVHGGSYFAHLRIRLLDDVLEGVRPLWVLQPDHTLPLVFSQHPCPPLERHILLTREWQTLRIGALRPELARAHCLVESAGIYEGSDVCEALVAP